MSKEYIAGISFSEDTGQIAIIEIREKETKLHYLEEFTKSNHDETWFLEKVLNPQTKILKKVSRVSVALDSSAVFLHSFPMDTMLSQTEQNEHVHWELSNFIADYKSKDYIYDLHVLKTSAREQVAEVLTVAVKRSLIYNIQESLAAKKLDLNIVDTAYFGAEQSLILSHPEVKIKRIALIYATPNRIDIGIEYNGRLVDYGYAVDNFPDSVINLLKNKVQDAPLAGIYCCGSGVTGKLIHDFQKAFSMKIISSNPFRQAFDVKSFSDFDKYAGKEHLFAACVGVALRKP